MSDVPAVRFLRDHPVKKTLFPQAGRAPVPCMDYVRVRDALLVCVKGFGVVTVWDGHILEESISHPVCLEEAPNILQRVTDEVRKTERYESWRGEYIDLSGLWSNGFYHWMLEYALVVIAALEGGFKGKFIIPYRQFAADTLTMLGVGPERVLVKNDRPWQIESLLVFRPISAPGDLRKFPGLLCALRERLLRAIGKERQKVKRIYVQRRPEAVKSRRVVNEGELAKVLERHGFQPMALEELRLKEQIRMAAGADCMVGAHGAGMVHCLFMEPESLVMEMFSPAYVNPCMLPLMEQLRHRYHMVPSTKIKEYGYGEDIEANIPMIEATLRRELGSVRNGR